MSSRYIKIIVTKGCSACDIQRTNVRKAIESLKNSEITVDVIDVANMTKKETRQLNLQDFPTTLFYRDGGNTFKVVGTYPIPVIVRYIQLYL